jgi:pSer/pThr/pTyr-binding forkhead associated (FHA) protein
MSKILIGRKDDCDVVLREHTVSRHHALIRRDGEHWILEDLGSKNGTGVNGVPLDGPVPLREGDFVTFGHLGLRFSATSQPALR